MRAAIIRRHKIDSVIIEPGRKIMGINVRFGYRGVSTGGSTGMKISESEALSWRNGRGVRRTSGASEVGDSGLVGLNLNSPSRGEERCFLARASASRSLSGEM
jgi:hypothetical protein